MWFHDIQEMVLNFKCPILGNNEMKRWKKASTQKDSLRREKNKWKYTQKYNFTTKTVGIWTCEIKELSAITAAKYNKCNRSQKKSRRNPLTYDRHKPLVTRSNKNLSSLYKGLFSWDSKGKKSPSPQQMQFTTCYIWRNR